MIASKIGALKTSPEALGLLKPARGQYPSVSKVLDATSDKTGLDAWRERVGEERAREISLAAASRGTAMHNIIERYFNDEPIPKEEVLAYRLYSSLNTYLRKIKPLAIEIPLWSDHLRVNGRADCVGYYNGDLCIIEFKTSSKEKEERWITNYFIQCAMYALMIYELIGVLCPKIVVVIGVENGFPQLFVRETKLYTRDAISRIREYHRLST